MSGPHILVVDDDRDNCRLVSEIFTNLGYRVGMACDGTSALELVKKNPYCLALLDYRMPDMDGLELLRKMNQVRPEMTSIFVTAYATINMIEAALEAGVLRVIPKPADINELISIVERIAGKAV